MDFVKGSTMSIYTLIPPYFKLFLETNPNSVVGLETELDNFGQEWFKYLFFFLSASIKRYSYMK